MIDGLTYVYCLVRSARRPATKTVPGGMPGSLGLRALDAGGGLWALVTTVPAAGYGEAALASGLQDLEWVGSRAVSHESVVEHFLDAGAVLPMQLFTLFTSDARVLDHVARDRPRIDAVVSRIEGRLEWGVRLSFDPGAATSDRAPRKPPARRNTDASGASYLTRKRDVLQASHLQIAGARDEADRLYGLLSREAADARRRTAVEQAVPGSPVVLDAAFLVPVTRSRAFQTAVRIQRRQLAGSGIEVSLTGPWPAYNFIDTPPGADAAATRRAARTGTRPRGSKGAAPRAAAKRPARGRA